MHFLIVMTAGTVALDIVKISNTILNGSALHYVTGPSGALLFDVKPEITLKESLELQF